MSARLKGKPLPPGSFGGRLREERRRLNLSQGEFAALAGQAKESQVNYEAERRSPNARTLMAWAAHGVDVLFLIAGRREPSQERAMLLGDLTALRAAVRDTIEGLEAVAEDIGVSIDTIAAAEGARG